MTSLQSRHIDNVYSIATGSALADPAASLVHKSWARCVREHGLDPTKPSPARILPAQEVRAHQQQLEHFCARRAPAWKTSTAAWRTSATWCC